MDKQIKERGIIFNGEMVRAILDGRKTQTRRILSPRQLKMIDDASSIGECYELDSGQQHESSQSYYRELCPFGKVGDRLYVRETFRVHSRATDVATLAYKASEQQSWTQQVTRVPIELCTKQVSPEAWTPSIHMPRWASRITLEITDIRVERLNDINHSGALAEGITDAHCAGMEVYNFSKLWRDIYGEQSWHSNPFVWVVEFKRVCQ